MRVATLEQSKVVGTAYGRTWSRATLIRTFLLVLVVVVLTPVGITIAPVGVILITTIVILMGVPWGAVIVTLWGFLTTSPVGVAIFLTEVVVGVVSKVIEITIILQIISSIRAVITS